MIKVIRTHDLDLVARLDRECFPDDEPIKTTDAAWWIATWDGSPVAFAGAKWWLPDNAVFLCRCGVQPIARGHGIQRRLIRTRLAWASEHGAAGVYTYTVPGNVVSTNNLLAAGFRAFEPLHHWAGSGANYWWCGS